LTSSKKSFEDQQTPLATSDTKKQQSMNMMTTTKAEGRKKN